MNIWFQNQNNKMIIFYYIKQFSVLKVFVVRLRESTVKCRRNGRDQQKVFASERCPSCREYSYSKWLKNDRNQHQVSPYRGVHLIESIVTVKGLKNGRNQHQVSPYRGVHLIEIIVTVKGLKNGRNQHQLSTL